jgi:hypothetical protein
MQRRSAPTTRHQIYSRNEQAQVLGGAIHNSATEGEVTQAFVV